MADEQETLTLIPQTSEDEAPASEHHPLSSSFPSRISSLSDLCPDLEALLDLASRGQWRAILDRVARARSISPHHHLSHLSFSILALLKLRRFPDAALDLHSLEPLPPSLPFALRYLHAELPLRLGDRAESLDRLYSLLDLARSKSRDDSRRDRHIWTRREAFVASALVRNHFHHREYDNCLLLIRDLLEHDPTDPELLSRLGYVLMQLGDLEGCRAAFARVEGLGKEGDVGYENLVSRNRALGFVLAKDYLSAVREYDECIERDPGDVAAINNKALCLMYSRDLSDSIKVLEGALERVPQAAVNELLVVNLCSMYELAYVNHTDIKRNLSSWIGRVAPEDFDTSCTRV